MLKLIKFQKAKEQSKFNQLMVNSISLALETQLKISFMIFKVKINKSSVADNTVLSTIRQ